MGWLSNPKPLKNKITASGLCLLEKNSPSRPDWTEEGPVVNVDPLTRTQGEEGRCGKVAQRSRSHFSAATPPSRWPQHPASAPYLSIQSINKGLFLNLINLLSSQV